MGREIHIVGIHFEQEESPSVHEHIKALLADVSQVSACAVHEYPEDGTAVHCYVTNSGETLLDVFNSREVRAMFGFHVRDEKEARRFLPRGRALFREMGISLPISIYSWYPVGDPESVHA
jgi:hypothetical protein